MAKLKCPECDTKLAKAGSTAGGQQRYRCKICKTRHTKGSLDAINKKPDAPEFLGNDRNNELAEYYKTKKAEGKTARFVIASLTNNSRINSKFMDTLEGYCDINDAMLGIIPIHYKNISLFQDKTYIKTWSKRATPYMIDGIITVGRNVDIMADAKIQATAVNPLSGLGPIGGSRSTIYGHPQLAHECVPTPASMNAKRMWTTGSVNIGSYSRTKEGYKGKFHHTMSALVVESYKGDTWVRQLGCDTKGGFHDLGTYYCGDTTREASIDVLTPGDTHEMFQDPKVADTTYFAKDSICAMLKPKHIMFNDILDGYSGSHHHLNDALLQYEKHVKGTNNYRAELDSLVKFLESLEEGPQFHIVPSNHDQHLYKFLNRANVNEDHVNALFIAEMQYAMRKAINEDRDPSPLKLFLDEYCSLDINYLDVNKPYIINKVDHSQHGDQGPNGSRGSARGLAKASMKMTIGHTHSSRIEKGVFQSGASAKRMDYERGISQRTQAHVLQYENGKRTIVEIFNGRHRAP